MYEKSVKSVSKGKSSKEVIAESLPCLYQMEKAAKMYEKSVKSVSVICIPNFVTTFQLRLTWWGESYNHLSIRSTQRIIKHHTQIDDGIILQKSRQRKHLFTESTHGRKEKRHYLAQNLTWAYFPLNYTVKSISIARTTASQRER